MNRTIRFGFVLSLLVSALLLATPNHTSAGAPVAMGLTPATVSGPTPGKGVTITGYYLGCDFLWVEGQGPNASRIMIETSFITVAYTVTVGGKYDAVIRGFAKPAGTSSDMAVMEADTTGSWTGTSYASVGYQPCPAAWGTLYPKPSPLNVETVFTDGRLNNNDTMQTAAIYCENGGLAIYGFRENTDQGFQVFYASQAELNAVPENPLSNTLVKSAFGITLWRLTSGAWQINGPNNYVYIWRGNCP